MKNYETFIYENLKNIKEYPNKILRDRVMTSAAKSAAPPSYRRRVGLKTVLIAAVIATVTTSTAFAYGEEIVDVIMRITSGNINVEQMDDLILGPGLGYSMNFEIINEVENINRELLENGPFKKFLTFEEASENAAFDIKIPTFLPEGMELYNIDVNQSTHHAVLTYYKEIPSYNPDTSEYRYPNHRYLFIFQIYVGQDAYLDIKTTYPIDTVMVGDTEAFLLDRTETIWTPENKPMTIPNLLFIKDGIFYNVTFESWEGIDSVETIVAITKSVG